MLVSRLLLRSKAAYLLWVSGDVVASVTDTPDNKGCAQGSGSERERQARNQGPEDRFNDVQGRKRITYVTKVMGILSSVFW